MFADYQRLMRSWYEQDRSGLEGDPCSSNSAASPIERDIEQAFVRAQSNLAAELLNLVHSREPGFFERLVIDVLLAMGYGSRRRDLARKLGRTGDGGVDGIISQDELGLDQIYLQAKRIKPGCLVPISDVRDFAGSLDAHHASKGVFLTTSHFSQAAVNFCQQVSRRVVLVDGEKFAELMIRYNIGVSVKQSYQIKRIDPEYFRHDQQRYSAPK